MCSGDGRSKSESNLHKCQFVYNPNFWDHWACTAHLCWDKHRLLLRVLNLAPETLPAKVSGHKAWKKLSLGVASGHQHLYESNSKPSGWLHTSSSFFSIAICHGCDGSGGNWKQRILEKEVQFILSDAAVASHGGFFMSRWVRQDKDQLPVCTCPAW